MKCWTNWGEDLRVCWATWIPVFLFNFSFCPLWMRVPVVAAVSFGFTAVLSAMRGAPQESCQARRSPVRRGRASSGERGRPPVARAPAPEATSGGSARTPTATTTA
ncbi:unnamed protein product, partial [Prorocentrum cordatum]